MTALAWVDDEARARELDLLERLLIERRRPIPPPPDDRIRILREVIQLIAYTADKKPAA